ncbi:hypothetical protein RB595_009737 [Gaeumannomyces hyphopodioides]
MAKPFFEVPVYVAASLIVSCVAMLFGLDTGSIGPVTTMSAFSETFGPLSATLHGVVVSSILLPGALSAMLAGVLADRYGRTRLIAIGGCTYAVGAAIECGSTKLGVFILGRLIKGVGEGLFLSTVYVYVAEISPPRVRGTLSALPQFLITLGIVTGFFTCYGTGVTIHASSLAWRLPLALGSLLGFLFSATVALAPPSPRWLVSQGRMDEARAVVASLGLDETERDEMLTPPDPADSVAHHDAEGAGGRGTTLGEDVKHMLSGFGYAFSRPFRARTAFGCFIMAFQQFSGIDGVLYYAPTLFRLAGLTSEQASFLASGVSALVIMVVTVPATLWADKWGRRTSTLVGGSLITVEMLLMGSLYAAGQVQPTGGAGRWVVIVTIYLFAVTFSVTWSIGLRTFLVESLPRKTRSSASALAQSSNWLANYLIALTTPMLLAKSTFGAYYFFGFATLFCTLMCAAFMFETKGKSLEVIEQQYKESREARTTGRWDLRDFQLKRMRVQVAPTDG